MYYVMYYVGLDIHKKTISYCVKDVSATFTWKGRSAPRDWNWTAG